jgi:ribosome-associated protein
MILIDTRQKAQKHVLKDDYFKSNNISTLRSKLPYGDYALAPRVSVDTKQNVTEIAQNMCGAAKEKKRFREECVLAQRAGARLGILIEDERIGGVTDLFGKTIRLSSGKVIAGEQLARAMMIMGERYGVEFEFCKPEDSGRRIMEILTDEQ